MCLVAVAWRAHPRYPLIVAGNRDEFHDRPAAAATWWDDPADVFGGRDLVAGGSWLAVSRSGRFAVVINNPRRGPGPGRDQSRGALVRDFVGGSRPSGRFLDAVQAGAERYAGFCLLAGTVIQVRALVSPPGAHRARWTLAPGVTVISNSPLESPWPKVRWLEEAVTGVLAAGVVSAASLLAPLARREPVAGGTHEPATGLTPFLVGERYGTRASTVIMLDSDGACEFVERRFAAGGVPAGEVAERFAVKA